MQEEGVRDSDRNQERVEPSLGLNYKLCQDDTDHGQQSFIPAVSHEPLHRTVHRTPPDREQRKLFPGNEKISSGSAAWRSLGWVWNNWNWILIERNVWSVVQCLPNWVNACHWVSCMICLYNWQYVSLNPVSVLTLSNYHNLSFDLPWPEPRVTARPDLVKAFARSIRDCRTETLEIRTNYWVVAGAYLPFKIP